MSIASRDFLVAVAVTIFIVVLVPSPWDGIIFTTLVIVRLAMLASDWKKRRDTDGQ